MNLYKFNVINASTTYTKYNSLNEYAFIIQNLLALSNEKVIECFFFFPSIAIVLIKQRHEHNNLATISRAKLRDVCERSKSLWFVKA